MKKLLILLSFVFVMGCGENARIENSMCVEPETPALDSYDNSCEEATDCAVVNTPTCSQWCGGCGDAVVAASVASQYKSEHALTDYVPPSDVMCGACNCFVVSCVEGECAMEMGNEGDENCVYVQ